MATERVTKQIFQTEFQTSGNLEPSVEQIKALQQNAKAASGDVLKLVEAEKKLEQAAAQAGVAVETETKKQSQFSASLKETVQVMKQVEAAPMFVKQKKSASEYIDIIEKYKKSLREANTLQEADQARTQNTRDLISAGSRDGFDLSQKEQFKLDAEAYEVYQETIKRVGTTVEEFIKQNDTLIDGANKKVASLTKQLRDLRAEAQQTEDPVLFNKLTQEAGELQDKINSTNELIKSLSSSTFFADTLVEGAETAVSAFTTLQGAIALISDDNEELAIAAQRAQGALALLAGSQKLLSDLKKGDNIITRAQIVLQRSYAAVVGTSTGATKAFRIALASTGIGLLIIAIGALVANIDKIKEALGGTNADLQKFIDLQYKSAKASIEASNAALSASESFNNYLKSSGLNEQQFIQNQIDNLNKYIIEQNDLYQQQREKLNIENIKKNRLNQEQVDREQELLSQSLTNAQRSLVERQNLETSLTKLRDDELKKQSDNRLKELAEEERHALAIAEIIRQGEDEVLNIRLGFAKRRRSILKSIPDTDTTTLKNINNQISELNLQISQNLEGTIAGLEKQVGKLRQQIFFGYKLGSVEFSNAVDEFFIASEKLEEANKLLNRPELFAQGSLNALNQQAQSIRNILDSLGEEDIDEILQQSKNLANVERRIARVNNVISPVDRSASPLELLDEEQRYQQEILNLYFEGELALAKTEKEKERIQREADEARLANEIEFQKKRIEILKQEGSEATEIEVIQAENELSILEDKYEQFTQTVKKSFKEIAAEVIEGFFTVLDAAAQAANTFIDIKRQENDRLAALQEKRIEDARAIAEKGNVAVLEAEQKKLDAITAQNKKFAETQISIQTALLIANSAAAIAKAAAEGGAAAPFTIAATLIALAAGFASARAQASAVAASGPGFKKGGYTGNKGANEVAGVVHGDEVVMDSPLNKIGHNRNWFKYIHTNRIDMDKLFGSKMVVGSNGNGDIVDAISKMPAPSVKIENKLNSDGIIAIQVKHETLKTKRKFNQK